MVNYISEYVAYPEPCEINIHIYNECKHGRKYNLKYMCRILQCEPKLKKIKYRSIVDTSPHRCGKINIYSHCRYANIFRGSELVRPKFNDYRGPGKYL